MKEGVSLPSLLPIKERLNVPYAMNGVFFQEETLFHAKRTGCRYPGVGILGLAGLALVEETESALALAGSKRATTGQS